VIDRWYFDSVKAPAPRIESVNPASGSLQLFTVPTPSHTPTADSAATSRQPTPSSEQKDVAETLPAFRRCGDLLRFVMQLPRPP